ncbi:hypothetical protein RB593_001588 [Gaeumannomyces tritici]
MKQYTETEIACALEGVRAGASVKSASKTWGIPRSTLRRRIGGGLPSCRAQAHRQRVDPSQELFLADWVLVQIALGYPPTHGELRYIASRTLEQGGDPQALGKRWVARFLARYPILKTQRARRIENARVNGASTEVIRAWWPRLEVPAVKAIKPENRYNLDECGLMEGLGSNGLVLGIRGCKPLQKKAFGTRGWTTIIECISATGKALDPLVIFKGLSVQKQWFPLEDQERFKPWRFHATQKGWTDDKTGVKWLEDIFCHGRIILDMREGNDLLAPIDEDSMVRREGSILHDGGEHGGVLWLSSSHVTYLPALLPEPSHYPALKVQFGKKN